MSRIAVIGAGWAGLAAAVHATTAGHAVTLFEMAAAAGGRARSVVLSEGAFDNGQHILIGAYAETLALMRRVGADPDALLLRLPLLLQYPEGTVLRSPGGPAVPAFVRAVLAAPRWTWAERMSLLAAAAAWRLRGFRTDPATTVAQLARRIAPRVRLDLVEPLCIAALNTPAERASGAVFLRVLRDALFGAAGGSDLLLPRAPLGALLPEPALAWLAAHGQQWRGGRRVQRVAPAPEGGWQVDGESFDAAVLACPPGEAARLAAPFAPLWSRAAAAFEYEPIVTTVLRIARRPAEMPPMLALHAGEDAPAQFAFDLQALRGLPGMVAFVVSGARAWVDRGPPALQAAIVGQARAALGLAADEPVEVVHHAAEKRATFLCTPALARPAPVIAAGCVAAGDYVEGPYPATLEGAVRSGRGAAERLGTGIRPT